MCDEALAVSIDYSILIIISKFKKRERVIIAIEDANQDASLSIKVGVRVSGWLVVSSIRPRN